MSTDDNQRESSTSKEFAEQASAASPGLLREFWDFLRYNKKWWLIPIIVVLLLLSLVILLSGTVAMPFIYPLF